MVVTELKEKYPSIKRIAYTCKSETCVLQSNILQWQKLYSRIQGQQHMLLCVEEEFEHKTKYSSGRASYVERNQSMIDNSDFCVFYFDKNYQPPKRKYSKRCATYYQPKSGTGLAFEYAKQKKKTLINIAQQ